MKKRIYRAAVSQRLRTTALYNTVFKIKHKLYVAPRSAQGQLTPQWNILGGRMMGQSQNQQRHIQKGTEVRRHRKQVQLQFARFIHQI